MEFCTEFVGLLGLSLLFVVFLALGFEVAFALGTLGVIALFLFEGGSKALGAVGYVEWTTTRTFVLVAVPLFIFMGEILERTRLTEGLFNAASAWLGRLPGGMLLATLVFCGVFSAASGSSAACAATVGGVAGPKLEQRGYDRRLTLGTLAAGATLDIMIPPSLVLIIYAAVVQESVGKLYVAALLPGLLLLSLFVAYIIVRAVLNPKLCPTEPAVSWRARFVSLLDVAPVLGIIFIVLGTIYAGLMTATEAAAGGAFASLVFALVARRLTFPILLSALRSAAETTAMILFIMVGALILSNFLAAERLPQQLTEFVIGLDSSRYLILALIFGAIMILGCFLEGMSIMMITLPITYPVVQALGFDSLWFGVAMVILIELALITPPVGMNLFIISNIGGGRPIGDVIAGAAPFVVLLTLALVLITAYPGIATWLPAAFDVR